LIPLKEAKRLSPRGNPGSFLHKEVASFNPDALTPKRSANPRNLFFSTKERIISSPAILFCETRSLSIYDLIFFEKIYYDLLIELKRIYPPLGKSEFCRGTLRWIRRKFSILKDCLKEDFMTLWKRRGRRAVTCAKKMMGTSQIRQTGLPWNRIEISF
jgi:hypothetical protein